MAVLVLIGLLVLPLLASLRLAQSFDPRLILGWIVVICTVTFWLFWHDKRRAQTNEWRTREADLHFVELLGGWPAAFLAQRMFRHKTSKTSYQQTFWAIVAFHEAAAFDFLSEWRYSHAAMKFFEQ